MLAHAQFVAGLRMLPHPFLAAVRVSDHKVAKKTSAVELSQTLAHSNVGEAAQLWVDTNIARDELPAAFVRCPELSIGLI